MNQQRKSALGGNKKRLGILGIASSLLIGITAGCANIGMTPVPEAPPGMISVIRMPSESSGTVQGLVNYNFLAPNPVVRTWLYEPLMIRDEFTCEAIPWLATGYEWETPSRLRLDIRQGVQWTDGVPFTAEDVAFNFNLGKEYPAVDRAGLWTEMFGAPATSVTATDPYTVVIEFSGIAVPKIDQIIGTQMFPKHIYENVGDPTLYIDTDPVSTGPFIPESYNGRRLVMVRNPTYWNPDLRVERIVLEGSFDANAAALKLRNGGLDIYLGDIPNPARSVERAGVGFYYPPGGTTSIAMNMTRPATGNEKFRQAVAYAIDKDAVALRASFGIMDPGSQTMLKLPVQEDQVPEQWRGEEFIPYDPVRAAELLDEGGFAMGTDGYRTLPDGSPMHLVFSVQAGWMDYLAMADVITRNLQDVGIDIRMVTTDPNAVDSMKKSGDYDMVLDVISGSCNRARELGGRLVTSQIPHDDELLLNIARVDDPEIDQLIDDWGQNIDPERESWYLDQIVNVFREEMPYVAIQYAPQRLIYRIDAADGWPSVDNPYPTNSLLRIITELRPRGES